MFAQTCCLLTARPLSLADLQPALKSFDVLGATEGQPDEHWAIGAPTLVLSMDGHPRGRVLIDAVGERWPDTMGRPDDQLLTRTWGMGGFGPLVMPGCLERAGTQAWAWRKAGDAVRGHQGFVRIRLAYSPEEGAPPLPEDRDRATELLAITRIAAKLLEVDGVRCYFDPNGESLRPAGFVWQALDYYDSEKELPLDVWTNVRVGKLDPQGEWMLMDCVGMHQLRLPDVEACFPAGVAELEAIDTWVRDVMAYLADAGDVIGDGDEVDGPDGRTWRAMKVEEGFSPPSRATIRFLPPVDDIPSHLKMTGSQAAQMADGLRDAVAASIGLSGDLGDAAAAAKAGEGDEE